MKNTEKIKLHIDILSAQNEKFLHRNNELRKEVEKLRKKEEKLKQLNIKYRTLYMKYKHQQNDFEKQQIKYKEIIRLLQAEIIRTVENDDLFEKIEAINIGI